MKKTKYELQRFAFYDYSGIQAHLEKRAEQGWLVEKQGRYFWKYRAIEPKKLHIAVTYFADASEFDPTPTEKQLQMEEYCERDGWRIATRWLQMQIFYNEAENPIPLETDAVTQVRAIHAAMKRITLPAYIILLCMGLYGLYSNYQDLLAKPLEYLATPSKLSGFPVWSLLLLSALLELGGYYLWYRKATEVAENGEILEVKSKHGISLILTGIAMLTMVLMFSGSVLGRVALVIALPFLAIVMMARAMAIAGLRKAGASRRVNQRVTVIVLVALVMVLRYGAVSPLARYGIYNSLGAVGSYTYDGREIPVYNDFLPLRIEDLTESENTEWSLVQNKEETFLLSRTDYTQWPLTEDNDVPRIDYAVTEVKLPFIYEMCKTAEVKAPQNLNEYGWGSPEYYEAVDATPWGANEVYQRHRYGAYINRYLLCYDNVFIEIDFDWEPTPEQMRIVHETLIDE